MKNYGKELILDIHDCYETRFNRQDLTRFFDELCDLIDMEQGKKTWWDYFWWPNWWIKMKGWDRDKRLFGTSAVQFISTSNITIHVIDNMRQIYLNIFSCKKFDHEMVVDYAQCYFWGEVKTKKVVERL